MTANTKAIAEQEAYDPRRVAIQEQRRSAGTLEKAGDVRSAGCMVLNPSEGGCVFAGFRESLRGSGRIASALD